MRKKKNEIILIKPYSWAISELTKRLYFDLFLSETKRKEIERKIDELKEERKDVVVNLKKLYDWR